MKKAKRLKAGELEEAAGKRCIWYERLEAIFEMQTGICLASGRKCDDPRNADCRDYAANRKWEDYKEKYNLEEKKGDEDE